MPSGTARDSPRMKVPYRANDLCTPPVGQLTKSYVRLSRRCYFDVPFFGRAFIPLRGRCEYDVAPRRALGICDPRALRPSEIANTL